MFRAVRNRKGAHRPLIPVRSQNASVLGSFENNIMKYRLQRTRHRLETLPFLRPNRSVFL